MKEYWNKFKEFRKDPKKRSISLLIVYGIFFIFVIIYVRSYKPAPPIESNNNQSIIKDSINAVTSYEYNYDIIKDNTIINISGTHYENKDIFKIDSDNYNVKDNYIYSTLDDNKTIEFPLDRLNYNNIEKLLNNFDYNYKIEYKNGQIKYDYIVSNKDYSTYYQEENNNEGNVYIITVKSDYINKIEIDLSEYYKINNYKITIQYTNINNISNIENK